MTTYKAKKLDGNRVVTGKVRLSYAHLFEPHSIEGNEPKYSVSIIIPKSDTTTIKLIQAVINEAKEEGKSKKWKGKVPSNLKTPLRDGDEDRPDDAAYADSYFINANSKKKPGLVDLYGNKNMTEEDIYSGCYARVSINFYPYSAAGNNGVAAGLQNVQKLEDGESLGGSGRSVDADFEYEEADIDDLL